MKRSRRSAAVVALTAAAVVVSSPGAWAADVKGSLVKSTKTSEWSTPSPDPSGIGYNLNTKRFLITDGEVEEDNMAWLYKGVNIFETETSGELRGTAVTVPWSEEPTGIAVNPANGQIYVSDDDQRSVFVLGSLNDTSPDVIGKAKFTAHGVDPDLEGVAYDSRRNEILLANGERGAGFWRVKPGTDGRFGTADDVVSPKILITDHGGIDPEGVAYDAVRDTVVMVDGSADAIFEMTATGQLLNRIDIKGLGIRAAAGIEVAPASDGSAGRNYYIVDRGVDNDSDPTENDGKLFEVRVTGLPDAGPGVNTPPTADAGTDQVAQLDEAITLTGSGFDVDGDPLTYRWSKLAGPGTVTFGSAGASSTTATFSASGRYDLRLTVTDNKGAGGTDDVVVNVADASGVTTLQVPIAQSSDDAREGDATAPTYVSVTAKTNDLGTGVNLTGGNANLPYPTKVGLRFADIPVPRGAQITSARIQFMADSVASSGPATFSIVGEASDKAATYSNSGAGKVSARTYNATTVSWTPPEWTTANQRGAGQLTPELTSVLQEIVDRPGWTAGNAAAFKIEGDGRRIARSVDAATATGATVDAAPVLLVEFSATGGAGPTNEAPTVNAGADQAVTLPAGATLDGTVTDDGLPNGKVTAGWSKVSGPGTVSFGNAASVDTTATFSAAGTYVLRLTANDGALTASDEVTVVVQAASTTPPGGGGGGGGTPTPEPPTTPTPPPAEVKTEVTLQAEHRAIVHPGTVRLDGTVTKDSNGAAGVTVELYVSRDGGDFELLDSGTSGSDGGFSFEDRPDVNSEYVVRSGASSSVAVEVRVRPRLGARLRHSVVKAGTQTAIVGFVSPAADGHVLRLQKRFGTTWRTVRTISVTGGDRTRFRFTVRPKASRAHWYRVVSPAQAGRALAVVGGKQLRLRAYRATVMRVNHRADLAVVRNTGRVAFTLEGWMLLERRSGHQVGLPDFTVRPGRVVRIHTGEGADNRRNLHLGTGEMWAPRGVAVLRDARLRLADRLRF